MPYVFSVIFSVMGSLETLSCLETVFSLSWSCLVLDGYCLDLGFAFTLCDLFLITHRPNLSFVGKIFVVNLMVVLCIANCLILT